MAAKGASTGWTADEVSSGLRFALKHDEFADLTPWSCDAEVIPEVSRRIVTHLRNIPLSIVGPTTISEESGGIVRPSTALCLGVITPKTTCQAPPAPRASEAPQSAARYSCSGYLTSKRSSACGNTARGDVRRSCKLHPLATPNLRRPTAF